MTALKRTLLAIAVAAFAFMMIKRQGKFADLPMLTSAPIEFYGKVIDQDGKPLSGVEVVGRTGSKTGFMKDEHRSYSTTTDARGDFKFKGFKGDGLVINLKKAGYNFGSERNRFIYAPMGFGVVKFIPERDKPVVFQMWKSLGAEPLIDYYGKSVTLPIDGTPVLIDLKKCAKAKGEGDLLVSITWGPRSDPGSYIFDWSAKLEVPEGGLIESTGDVMFIAPADGYQKSIEYHFTARDMERVRDGEVHRTYNTYYIKSRKSGIFSRAQIAFNNNPIQGEADVTLRVQLNPKPGSRNLEFDPKLKAEITDP